MRLVLFVTPSLVPFLLSSGSFPGGNFMKTVLATRHILPNGTGPASFSP